MFTLRDIAQLLGVLDNHTRCARWARCWCFTIQNTVRRALNQRFHALQRVHSRFARKEQDLRSAIPKDLADCLSTLMSREKALFLWNVRSQFPFPPAAA